MRILIADDESIIRLGLKALLNEMGHEVLAAANGREALQMARKHLPDLAILDIKMPFSDGLQTAKVLDRERPLPILLLTAFSEQDLIEEAADLPVQGYLIKPIKPEELSAAIAIASRRFAENQKLRQQAEKLQSDLETRKLIDRAKGKLMAAGYSEADAYHAIQQLARSNQQSMRQAALVVLKQ